NDLQPLHTLEPDGRLQPDICRTGRPGPRAQPDHDRCDPSQGSLDGREHAKKGALPRRIGRTKGGLNSKLHAVCDGQGWPIIILLSEGQMSDHKGAFLLLASLPGAKELLGNKGYDSDWFREALAERGITPCIPPRSNRKVQHDYDKTLYRQRHKIENVFGRLKDWRRVATRYDRCAHTFMSAICIAATIAYWS
ncbi:MAG: IS5 family transposase, partial [Rhodospirillaceae bacterium]|nr:IS5 family transposase [Rhodospirillaceae bacterium]